MGQPTDQRNLVAVRILQKIIDLGGNKKRSIIAYLPLVKEPAVTPLWK